MTLNFFNKHNKPPEEKPKEFWRLKEWFNDLSEDSINKLKLFNTEIIKLNPSLNLVSEKPNNLQSYSNYSSYTDTSFKKYV